MVGSQTLLYLASWRYEKTDKANHKAKCQTQKAEDPADLIILRLQIEILSCFGEKNFLSTFGLQRLLKGITHTALSCLV